MPQADRAATFAADRQEFFGSLLTLGRLFLNEDDYKRRVYLYCSHDEIARQETAHPGLIRVLVHHYATDTEIDGLLVEPGWFCLQIPYSHHTVFDFPALKAAIELVQREDKTLEPFFS